MSNKPKNIIKSGDVIDLLTVIKEIEPISDWYSFKKFECLCSCGNVCVKSLTALRHSFKKRTFGSCGCKTMEKTYETLVQKRNFDIAIGEIIGKVTVVRYIFNLYATKYNQKVECRCICGNLCVFKYSSLLISKRGNKLSSCGCSNTEAKAKPQSAGNNAIFSKILLAYKKAAKDAERDFLLTDQQVRKLFSSNCFYCNSEPKTTRAPRSNFKNRIIKSEEIITYNGIDRLNNSLGYTEDNVVACCQLCNWQKSNHTKEDFLKFISNIVSWDKNTINNTSSVVLNKNEIVSVKKIIRSYKNHAKDRNLCFDLSDTFFISLIFNNCYYCGPNNIKKTKNGISLPCNGIDRINNQVGYIVENVVTCCSNCNRIKYDLNIDDFYKHVENIYKNLKRE